MKLLFLLLFVCGCSAPKPVAYFIVIAEPARKVEASYYCLPDNSRVLVPSPQFVFGPLPILITNNYVWRSSPYTAEMKSEQYLTTTNAIRLIP